MSKEKLIPEIRFPDFKNDGKWDDNTLSDVCDVTNGKANAQDHVEEGKYPLFDRSEVIKSSNEFIFDCEAVIIPGEGMRFIPKHYNGKFNLHQRAYALKDFDCSGKFVYYSMLHRSDLLSQKAVRSTVLSLRLPILQEFPIEVPRNPKEQQKIASCLSSLDEVISAHSQKMDLLKDHKKGLMQNLFPSAGEKVPKYRFKEFEKDGEWVSYLLKDLTKINQGLQIPISERFTEKVENSFFYITNEFLKSNSERRYYIKDPSKNVICNEDDVLMTRTGNTGQVVTGVSGAFHNNFFKIQFDRNILNKDFLVFFLRLPDTQRIILSYAGTSTIPDLNHSDFYRILMKIPSSKEQQKIASCLSSLDALITAQVEKIEQLKLHKKGLMQGLFPKLDD